MACCRPWGWAIWPAVPPYEIRCRAHRGGGRAPARPLFLQYLLCRGRFLLQVIEQMRGRAFDVQAHQRFGQIGIARLDGPQDLPMFGIGIVFALEPRTGMPAVPPQPVISTAGPRLDDAAVGPGVIRRA